MADAAVLADELQAEIGSAVDGLVADLTASNGDRQTEFDSEAQFGVAGIAAEIEA